MVPQNEDHYERREETGRDDGDADEARLLLRLWQIVIDHRADEREDGGDHSHLQAVGQVQEVKVPRFGEFPKCLPEELFRAATLLLDGLQVTRRALGLGTKDWG